MTGPLEISNFKFLLRTAHYRESYKNSFMDNAAYLFVYGTLRSQMNDPLHRVLETYAIFVGTGSFQGKLYDLGRYPGAVRSRRNTDRIIGEIYRLSEPRRTLEILDEYEGTDSGANG